MTGINATNLFETFLADLSFQRGYFLILRTQITKYGSEAKI